jgi:DoxX-like protein
METTQNKPGKGKLIIYWIATALLGIGMLQSGIFAILRNDQWVKIITDLGYPLYFLTILGVWKILGVIAIVIPKFKLLKEWAYAGFFFAMTGALVSHLAVGDYAVKSILGPLFQAIFVIISWYFRPASRKIVL